MSDEVNSGNADSAGLATAATTAGSGLIASWYNAHEARRAREWQEKMWNKQNEYNLPVNQVARLKEAGINPNLAFGSAASAMGTSVPSSPPLPKWEADFGEATRSYYRTKLEYKNVLSEIRQRNAATENQEMQNKAFGALLEDYIQSKLWGYRSEAAKGQWFYKNNDEWFGTEMLGKQFKNDLIQAETSLAEAKRNLTEVSIKRAWQDYSHLARKYHYEDSFYKRGLNPYETSTLAGGLRTIGGLVGRFGANPGQAAEDFGLFLNPLSDGLNQLWDLTKKYYKHERDKYRGTWKAHK